jgi:hypothetical protein
MVDLLVVDLLVVDLFGPCRFFLPLHFGNGLFSNQLFSMPSCGSEETIGRVSQIAMQTISDSTRLYG